MIKILSNLHHASYYGNCELWSCELFYKNCMRGLDSKYLSYGGLRLQQ